MTSLITICLGMALSMPGLQGPQEELSMKALPGYTLAELKLTNTEPLNSNFLRSLFHISKGDPYNTEPLRETLERIRQLYLELGHVDFAYNPHLDINKSEKSVSCTFEFILGTRYYVNRIHIFGAGSDEEEMEIRDTLILEENRIFSPSALYGSIRRLNNLLESKDLALQKYEYKRSSERPGTVDVSIWIQAGE